MQCGNENYFENLANRLKDCLPSVISQSQSAFMKNRVMTDNVILAQEVIHFIRGKNSGEMILYQ